MPAERAAHVPPGFNVQEVPLEKVLPLRGRLLRAGRPIELARSRQDGLPDTRHLAAVTDTGAIVGVVTYFAADSPIAPGRRAVRFRGMAVDDARQGQGIGRALMRTLVERARGAGVEVLWANGRDTALSFYERIGFRVAGDGFLDDDMQLPHHLVIADVADVTA